MDGCLAPVPKPPWNTVNKQSIFAILKTIFHTLAVAMRYEPANAKFFETEVCCAFAHTWKRKRKRT
jgi:hypothetical protein